MGYSSYTSSDIYYGIHYWQNGPSLEVWNVTESESRIDVLQWRRFIPLHRLENHHEKEGTSSWTNSLRIMDMEPNAVVSCRWMPRTKKWESSEWYPPTRKLEYWKTQNTTNMILFFYRFLSSVASTHFLPCRWWLCGSTVDLRHGAVSRVRLWNYSNPPCALTAYDASPMTGMSADRERHEAPVVAPGSPGRHGTQAESKKLFGELESW